MDHSQNSFIARKTLRKEVIINFCTNFMFNALCALLINHGMEMVKTDFWNVLLDIVITTFCTCVLTTFFCVAAAKRYIRAGVFSTKNQGKGLLFDLPRRPYPLGASLSGMVGLPLGALLGLTFTLLHIPVLPLHSFILYKGILGGIIGACTCTIVLLCWQMAGKGESV